MGRLVERDLDFADIAPVRAEGRTEVDGTPAEAWAVLLDYPGWPRWFAGARTCRATSEPATGVGSTRVVTLQAPGSSVVERFIAWEDERLWAFTVTEMTPAPFRSLVERVTITPITPERTAVTYRMALEPKRWLAPVAPLLRRGLDRNLARAMDAFAAEVVSRRG